MLSPRKPIASALAALFIVSSLTPPVIAACDLTMVNDPTPAPVEELVISETNAAELLTLEISYSLPVQDSAADVEIIANGSYLDPNHLAFNSDGIVYAPLRDVCTALGATNICFDADTFEVKVLAEGLEITVPLDEPYLIANGRYLYVEQGFVIKDDCTMAPVRTVCEAFGASLVWDEADAAVHITSGGEPIRSGDLFYDQDDLCWMTRIIYAESRGEPFLGMIAVGNVVMNRVASDAYPDTVYGVIFDKRFGVQFTPTLNGSIYSDPYSSRSCEAAAKLALEGADVAGDAMYFASASITCWASRNRSFAAQIGSHSFYY